jgi:hypothetical protein
MTCADFLILVLDPTVKDLYFWHQWSSERYAISMGQLEEVVSNLIRQVLYANSCLV